MRDLRSCNTIPARPATHSTSHQAGWRWSWQWQDWKYLMSNIIIYCWPDVYTGPGLTVSTRQLFRFGWTTQYSDGAPEDNIPATSQQAGDLLRLQQPGGIVMSWYNISVEDICNKLFRPDILCFKDPEVPGLVINLFILKIPSALNDIPAIIYWFITPCSHQYQKPRITKYQADKKISNTIPGLVLITERSGRQDMNINSIPFQHL